MKMWSRGLGKRELVMDCREYVVKKDPDSDNIMIFGQITDPVHWEFKITVGPDDIPGVIKLFLHFCVIKLTLMNMFQYVTYLFNRKKYAPPENIVEKVDTAFNSMMNKRARPTRSKVSDDDDVEASSDNVVYMEN